MDRRRGWLQRPGRFNEPAKLRFGANGVQVGIVLKEIESVALAQRRRQELKSPNPVGGVLLARKGVDAGDLIETRRAGVASQRVLGIAMRRLALTQSREEDPSAAAGLLRFWIEIHGMIEDLEGVLSPAQFFRSTCALFCNAAAERGFRRR